MPLPLTSDLAAIMNLDEFAQSITYNGGAISAIFDNETVPIDAGGFAQVHQEQPRLTVRTIDVPSIGEGEAVVVNGVTYAIRAWIHDGTGVTEIRLEKA